MINLPCGLIKRMGMRTRIRNRDGSKSIMDIPQAKRNYQMKLLKSDGAFEAMTESQFIEVIDALPKDRLAPFAKVGNTIYFGGVNCLSEYRKDELCRMAHLDGDAVNKGDSIG